MPARNALVAPRCGSADADDDDGIGGRRRRALALLHDDLSERIPERCLPARGELVRERVAELVELIRRPGAAKAPARAAGRPRPPPRRAARSIERVRTTVPPASRTALATANETPWSTGPTNSTATCFPSSRPGTTAGYAASAKSFSACAPRFAASSDARATSRSCCRSAIWPFRFARSASLTKPLPERPTPTRIPITRATKTAVSDATW